ncbi:MAG TPA: DUF2461 domain-containing protein [Anaerolineales bacterium]|nr:DUF2461 domain-containing protein [Anaerolineales bacterium]
MSPDTDLKPVMTFLAKLTKNNDRTWFEAHRQDYETARLLFMSFVQELIDGLNRFEDMRGVTPKDCVMRIYRDVRFSKDKSPYKTGMSASLGPGGRKSYGFQYYIHLEPGGRSMVAGGLHEPEPAQLNAFRANISRDARDFKAKVGAKAFRQYFGDVSGERLKTAPQGYDRAHAEIELLRLKEVVAVHKLADDVVVAPGLGAHVVKACAAMKPFLDYLRVATG